MTRDESSPPGSLEIYVGRARPNGAKLSTPEIKTSLFASENAGSWSMLERPRPKLHGRNTPVLLNLGLLGRAHPSKLYGIGADCMAL